MADWPQRAASRPAPGFKYMMVVRNGKHYVANEIVVHRFQIPWSEDVMLMAGMPLYAWEQSEAGRWVKEHAVETPRWERYTEHVALNERFAIIARLTEPDQTFFRLTYE